MKQYVIDELRYRDYEKIKTYLNKAYGESELEGIYWVPIDDELLTREQAMHDECRPLYFVLDLSQHRLCCELLARTKNRIRCSCMCYADEAQRNWMITMIDTVFEKLEIVT